MRLGVALDTHAHSRGKRKYAMTVKSLQVSSSMHRLGGVVLKIVYGSVSCALLQYQTKLCHRYSMYANALVVDSIDTDYVIAIRPLGTTGKPIVQEIADIYLSLLLPHAT